jgi:glycosyltransferase involved in cell wall biosynthesis
MKKFNIDVIIVTRNRYPQLVKCVGSLFAGSLRPANLIIVDGSDRLDKKIKVKIAALSRKSGIGLIYLKIPHRGVAYSRNQGMSLVRSSYFAFIDDDEYAPRRWLKNVSKLLTDKKNIDVLAGPKIPSDSKNYWHRLWRSLLEREFDYIGRVDTIPSGNSIYSTSFVKKHNLKFNETFKQCSEDQAFSWELRKIKANIFFHKDLWVRHDCRKTPEAFIRQWFYYGLNKFIYQKKYLGSGGISEPTRWTTTFINFRKTFPYSLSLSSLDILPGAVLLHFVFLAGFLYSFLNLNEKKNN